MISFCIILQCLQFCINYNFNNNLTYEIYELDEEECLTED